MVYSTNTTTSHIGHIYAFQVHKLGGERKENKRDTISHHMRMKER